MNTSPWTPRAYLLKGMLTLIFLAGGFIIWAVTVKIDGAIVVYGEVSVEPGHQSVQHPDGGVIAEIHVQEGALVMAGDPILSLDGTEFAVKLGAIRREFVETLARLDRLTAEIRGDTSVAFRDELSELGVDKREITSILAGEIAFFEARKMTLLQTEIQLDERKAQTLAAVSGREIQLSSTQDQLAIIQDDLIVVEDLFARGLTESARVSQLRREAARLEGEIGELDASISEARSAIAGFEVERLRQRSVFVETVNQELNDLRPKAATLRDQLYLINGKIARLVLRAPMNGIILGLQAKTIGGVVRAETAVATLVPTDVPLVMEVQVDPGQIDRIHPGQSAIIRFPNVSFRKTPEREGLVSTVSPDAVMDPATGRRFFVARLVLTTETDAILPDTLMVPGMPLEALVRVDSRTPASFLLKPVADYWTYAMRE